MMIAGSNTYGKALPPHFQFMSSAQLDEGKQIKSEFVCYMRNVMGKFRLGQTTLCPSTFGINKKGGMDMVEFKVYICNQVMRLYPNAKQSFGKWVILKCDSAPSWMNLDLLADLQSSSLILFPGVPNMMAIMQETNQNYSPFKMKYCNNLDAVVKGRIKKKKLTYIPL